MLLRNAILVILALVCAHTVHAGKVYKWVDENGNTQYSQTPPPKSVNTSSELKMGSIANTVNPIKRGKNIYCGESRLPNSDAKPARIISSLQQYLHDWRQEKERYYNSRMDVTRRMNDRLDQNIQMRSKYNGRTMSHSNIDHYKKQLRDFDKRIAQTDCKIRWAQKKLDGFGDEKKLIAQKYDTINATLKDLENKKIATCGKDEREGVIVVNDAYREYRRCVTPFNREIQSLERKRRAAKRDYEDIQNW